MELVLQYLPSLLELLGSLVVVATIIVRITPSKSDDENVSKIASFYFKYLNYLPTLGVNPRTKKMEELINELKSEAQEVKQ